MYCRHRYEPGDIDEDLDIAGDVDTNDGDTGIQSSS